jgi:flagellar basal-body rod modification protein FlgD
MPASGSVVSGVYPTTNTAAATGEALKKSNVTSDQFLQLLVTQLQNQDPLNPLSNEDFLAQLAQFQSLQEAMETAANTKNLLLGQQLAAASGLIGKYVVVADNKGQEYVGRVDKVAVDNGEVLLVVGNIGVSLADIREVRNEPPSQEQGG